MNQHDVLLLFVIALQMLLFGCFIWLNRKINIVLQRRTIAAQRLALSAAGAVTVEQRLQKVEATANKLLLSFLLDSQFYPRVGAATA